MLPRVTSNKGTLDVFLSQATFSLDLLNFVMVIWLLRQALAFTRFEDPILRAAFKLSNRQATLRSGKWAASMAHELYSCLRDKAISDLMVGSIDQSCSLLSLDQHIPLR